MCIGPVEYLGSIQQDVGLTTGARIVGDRMFVTSGKNISSTTSPTPRPRSSSPKWAGKDDVLYSIDYQRGIDILRWKGEHYVPRRGRAAARDRLVRRPVRPVGSAQLSDDLKLPS